MDDEKKHDSHLYFPSIIVDIFLRDDLYFNIKDAWISYCIGILIRKK